MAKTLSNTGIAKDQLILSSHVSQSVDAFTGADAYDIVISGSMGLTGSLIQRIGDVRFLDFTQVNKPNVVAYDVASGTLNYIPTASLVDNAITGSSMITASVAFNVITFTKGDGSTFNITVDTGSDGVWYDGGTFITSSKDVRITGSLTVSGSSTFTNVGPAVFEGNVTSSGNISSSGFVSASVLNIDNVISPNNDNTIKLSESVFRVENHNTAVGGATPYAQFNADGGSDRVDLKIYGPQPRLELDTSGSGVGNQFKFMRNGALQAFHQLDQNNIVQSVGSYNFLNASGLTTNVYLNGGGVFEINMPTTASQEISSSAAISASSFVGDGSKLTNIPETSPEWFNGGTFITSSKDLRVSGSLQLSGSTHQILGTTVISQGQLEIRSNIIKIGNEPGDEITMSGSVGVTASTVNIDSADIQLPSIPSNLSPQVLFYDTATNQIAYGNTSSIAGGGGSDVWFDGTTYITSSVNTRVTGGLEVSGGITGSDATSAIFDLFGVSKSRAEVAGDVIKWDNVAGRYTNGPLVVFSGFNISSSNPNVSGSEVTLTNDQTLNFVNAISYSKAGDVVNVEIETGGGSGVWFDGTTYITSSVETRITGALKVNAGALIDPDPTFTLVADTGSNVAGPVIDLIRLPGSEAATNGNYLGQLKFKGDSDTGVERVYAKISGKIGSATNGNEDGLIEFMTRKDGANKISARLTHTDLKLINDTGIEADGASLFENNVTITGSSFDATIDSFTVSKGDGVNMFVVNETGSKVASGSRIFSSTTISNIGTSTGVLNVDSNCVYFVRQGTASSMGKISLPTGLTSNEDGLTFEIIYYQNAAVPAGSVFEVSASDGTGILANTNLSNGEAVKLKCIYSNTFDSLNLGTGTGWLITDNSVTF